MSNRPTDSSRRPPIRLPFDDRKEDAGAWAFDHRVGLCITLIVYLLLAIAFVTSRIIIEKPAHMQGLVIDIEMLDRLAQQKEALERQIEERMPDYDFSDVRNRYSSDQGSLDESLRDDRGSDVSALNEGDRQLREEMAANREAYEQGLREAGAIRDAKSESGGGQESAEKIADSKVQGNVTVSYSLENPTRYRRRLPVPAYKCEGGGRVVVDITVDRNGTVVSASVNKTLSDSDSELYDAAVETALRSKFDLNQSAPQRQQGTITYIFVPQ